MVTVRDMRSKYEGYTYVTALQGDLEDALDRYESGHTTDDQDEAQSDTRSKNSLADAMADDEGYRTYIVTVTIREL